MVLVARTLQFRSQQDAKNVVVVGSWDDWHGRTVMQTEGNGEWKALCQLPPGRVSFKFVCDGVWTTAGDYDVVDDGYGGVNNQMVVEEENGVGYVRVDHERNVDGERRGEVLRGKGERVVDGEKAVDEKEEETVGKEENVVHGEEVKVKSRETEKVVDAVEEKAESKEEENVVDNGQDSGMDGKANMVNVDVLVGEVHPDAIHVENKMEEGHTAVDKVEELGTEKDVWRKVEKKQEEGSEEVGKVGMEAERDKKGTGDIRGGEEKTDKEEICEKNEGGKDGNCTVC